MDTTEFHEERRNTTPGLLFEGAPVGNPNQLRILTSEIILWIDVCSYVHIFTNIKLSITSLLANFLVRNKMINNERMFQCGSNPLKKFQRTIQYIQLMNFYRKKVISGKDITNRQEMRCRRSLKRQSNLSHC